VRTMPQQIAISPDDSVAGGTRTRRAPAALPAACGKAPAHTRTARRPCRRSASRPEADEPIVDRQQPGARVRRALPPGQRRFAGGNDDALHWFIDAAMRTSVTASSRARATGSRSCAATARTRTSRSTT
jgi:hypothetical protein